MIKVYMIVVIYNEECDNSITCKCLMDLQLNYKIIVCDNSTVQNSNKEYCQHNGWQYIKMDGNQGISKAYNKAIDIIPEIDAWIILLDQDTELNCEYFNKMEQSIKDDPTIYVHVPIVKDSVGIMSPGLMKDFNVERIEYKNLDNIKTNLTAINTGMVINRVIFNNGKRYDERFFLDYIDHNFIKEYREMGGKLKIFKASLFQDFSNNKHDNFDSDYKRFNIYIKDFKLFCNSSLKGKMFYYLKVVYRAIKLSIIYKNNRFLKAIVKK